MTKNLIRWWIKIYNNIVFVCTGNTCRSPFAEQLFKKMLYNRYGEKADHIKISSSGTYAFPGVTPPSNAIRVAEMFDVNLSDYRSKAISLNVLNGADVVFCMTSRHKSNLVSKYPYFEDKIHILKKYSKGISEEKHESTSENEDENQFDIQDPIGQDTETYTEIFKEIQIALEKVIERWEEEEGFKKKMSSVYAIAIGSDHGGFCLKKELIGFLQEMGHKVKDFGVLEEGKAVDYPDYIRPVAMSTASGESDFGIVVCGSGIGASIVANKVKGVRAALCRTSLEAKLSRQHNNANILALGERLTTPMVAKEMVREWLSTDFEGGRHQQRIDKIDL